MLCLLLSLILHWSAGQSTLSSCTEMTHAGTSFILFGKDEVAFLPGLGTLVLQWLNTASLLLIVRASAGCDICALSHTAGLLQLWNVTQEVSFPIAEL